MLNMGNMDSLDYKLINILQRSFQINASKIAEELGVSPATVRRRLRILINNKVIGINAVVNPVKIGLSIAVFIALDVVPAKLESAMQELDNHPHVTWIAIVTGRYDLLLAARFSSNEELSVFLKKELAHIGGIVGCETFISLELKRKYHYATL